MPLNNPDPAAAKIASGSYAGNNTVNRAIPHGLVGTPKLIVIQQDSSFYRIIKPSAINYVKAAAAGQLAVTAPDSTNFYVGNATSYDFSANLTGETYYWVAFS